METLIFDSLGDMVAMVILAIPLTLCFEYPFTRMGALIFKADVADETLTKTPPLSTTEKLYKQPWETKRVVVLPQKQLASQTDFGQSTKMTDRNIPDLYGATLEESDTILSQGPIPAAVSESDFNEPEVPLAATSLNAPDVAELDFLRSLFAELEDNSSYHADATVLSHFLA
ncbi:unnamed protein product [Ceutorhynchus assimilis]|uniref:Uncharacterized protein n=1 Tax=Ceutorhynchus assimilis TaxID=467358 RepID=A0A9N9QME0_9CUCU|nr:unnamed protein product [Ceutorhynchus assimilis]